MVRALLVGAVLLVSSVALAEPPQQTLYFNRCVGGCMIHGGATDDATAAQSSIPCAGTVTQTQGGTTCSDNSPKDYTVSEFQNNAGVAGAAADAEWNEIMQCLREVYSPYNVVVTDVKPTNGVTFTEGIIAGLPEDIGQSSQFTGGVSVPRFNGDCGIKPNVISFSFANATFWRGPNRTTVLCGVAGQETAHAFGLDHEYSFADGTSACRSPMTYRTDCGGEQFFRDLPANCGEYATRTCRCGGLQNSHKALLKTLGAGTPITSAPTVSLIAPTGSTATMNQVVAAKAYAQRGIQKTELWLNNHMWAQTSGAAWGANGQPESTYQMNFAPTVPDGVIDIVVKAYDDIGSETDSPTLTVTKGAPCANATSCLTGQKCEAGKCFWDAPTGVLGDTCAYNEFCVSDLCQGTDSGQFCTQNCVVGSEDGCPANYDCVATSETGGVCLAHGAGGGGCCSVEGHESSRAVYGHFALGLFVVGLVLRRRRRVR